jgi:hypothetical protein
MYDARIGRWLSTDPKNIGFSPYYGMGNNPVNEFDKDGGDPDWVKLNDGTAFFDPDVHSDAEVQAKYGAGTEDISGKILQSTVSGNWISFGYTEQSAHIVPFYQPNDPSTIFRGLGVNPVALNQIADGIQFLAYFMLPGGSAAASFSEASVEEGSAEIVAAETEPAVVNAAEDVGSNILSNKIAGDAFRDEIANGLEAEGRDVSKEVYKWTPFGKRFIDIEVSQGGKVLGGIETKLGSSRYTALQRIKDIYLEVHTGYKVQLIRSL